LAITVESDEVGERRLGPGSAPRAVAGPDSEDFLPAVQPGAAPAAAAAAGEDGLLSGEEEPADELTAYNRYLALLAIRGKAKTWRNPHGV
jgi:hypothetical protein